MIKSKNITFEYIKRDEEGNVVGINKAVDDVSLDVHPGQFIAILGHNGCGKSTFARQLNALLHPTEGTLLVNGMDVTDVSNEQKIRQTAGMVFQNPDNQIIGAVVEEDVAFGPENLGVDTMEIWDRVEDSLRAVNMIDYRKYCPNNLSGGQKQRIAIAGTLAMKPKCIILDEPTAMLDPIGRREVIDAIYELNRKENVTIILITHYLEEIKNADKVYVMNEGKIVLEGTPIQIFARQKELKKYHLEVPQYIKLAKELQEMKIIEDNKILTIDDLVDAIKGRR